MCPVTSSFYAYLGVAAATAFSCIGSAYGTAKAGTGVVASGLVKPSGVVRNLLPVIMAGILGIYGLLTVVSLTGAIGDVSLGLPLFNSYAYLASGLVTGTTALCAGIAIGVAGEAAAKAVAYKGKLFVVMLLNLVFGEALAIYGLIVSLILALKGVSPSDAGC
ncbi:V-ATPase proteolipid subunit C, eukaryotic [Kipferlia bialata]|uniref:V-type proton ATPase proteolipid subunit n=1 Tax=Kipferlia bialata TaxID=797122 RepID=A0A9K3CQI2_9EUKA|nr:V-ATPase proteolipid subunit C, eukaryotic [Kipferlia bialata]|eukprot:g1306.t1